jgi:hypothetical protein
MAIANYSELSNPKSSKGPKEAEPMLLSGDKLFITQYMFLSYLDNLCMSVVLIQTWICYCVMVCHVNLVVRICIF